MDEGPANKRLRVVRAVFADAALALVIAIVITFVIASLAAAGVITMSLAYALLALAWLVAVAGSFLVPWPFPHRHRAVFATFLAIMLGAVGWYEAVHYEKPPSAKEIAEELAKITAPAPTTLPHARLEHNTIEFPEDVPGGNRLIKIHFQNHGSIHANYAMIFGMVSITETEYTKQDQDMFMDGIKESAAKSAPLSTSGNAIYPGQDISLTLSPGITPSDWAALKEGKKWLYLFSASRFSDENTDNSEYWLSEACMKIERSFSGGAPCVDHYFIHKVKQ
jgi:hypothetical protein